MSGAKTSARPQRVALYRKYRSRDFEEVIGQGHITKTLATAIKNDHISHAYLFTGPRGVGKTSVARILAHKVNGIKYDGEANQLDIVEIDAASNRGIDEIRDLREKVFIAPASLRYKVYIIDEVHMLTQPAFNALLKTLEEPPQHAIFVLATTEVHKVPATIISRTQRHSFLPIPETLVVKHLQYIAGEEKINITDDALHLIARHGEGSLRDSISLLDQLASDGSKKITGKYVRELLGLVKQDSLAALTDAVVRGDIKQVQSIVSDLLDEGATPELISRQLLEYLRQRIVDEPASLPVLLPLVDDLLSVFSTFDKTMRLYSSLLRNALARSDSRLAASSAATDTKKVEPSRTSPAGEPEPEVTVGKLRTLDQAAWDKILKKIKTENNSLYAILRMAKPQHDDHGVVVLSFGFPFHKNRLDDKRNKHIVEQALTLELGSPMLVRTMLDRSLSEASSPQTTPEADADIQNVLSTMGGGEVIEV